MKIQCTVNSEELIYSFTSHIIYLYLPMVKQTNFKPFHNRRYSHIYQLYDSYSIIHYVSKIFAQYNLQAKTFLLTSQHNSRKPQTWCNIDRLLLLAQTITILVHPKFNIKWGNEPLLMQGLRYEMLSLEGFV